MSSRQVPHKFVQVVIQPRDLHVFNALFVHRYLSVRHLHALVFRDQTRRVVQARLRRLWAAGFLSRRVNVREDWARPGLRPPTEYLYALAIAGARQLADSLQCPLGDIPHTDAQNRRGFVTLQHHLVVTDFMVALSAALTNNPATSVTLAGLEREHELRVRLGAHAMHAVVPRPWLIPDGVVHLRLRDGDAPVTFYVEVVRSLPVGGRAAVYDKLARYIDALTRATMPSVWSHKRVAAVLIVAPTVERAERLRTLAERLDRCRDRFWFAPYLAPTAGGSITSAFCRETVLDDCWCDGDGALRSLLRPLHT